MAPTATRYADILASHDLTSEDGYRAFTKDATGVAKALASELAFDADFLFNLLKVTPVSNPRGGGLMNMGDDATYYARRVRAHLRRAAQSAEFMGGQIVGAWSVFENGFIVPGGVTPKGMNMNGGGSGGSSTRSRSRRTS